MREFFVKHQLLFKILVVVFALLYTLLQAGYVIAMENKGAINDFLQVTDYKIVDVGNDEVIDTDYFTSNYSNLSSLMQDGQSKAEEVEAEGAVLLKNDGALPVSKTSTVMTFGYASYSPTYGGSGSAQSGNAYSQVDLMDGLENAGLSVDKTLYNFYKNNKSYAPSGYDTKDASWSDLMGNATVVGAINSGADVAIMVVKRTSGEKGDVPYSYLQLSANEKSVLQGLKALKGSKFNKIILLLNTPNQIEAKFLVEEDLGIDAALWIGAVGQTGMNAVGKILVGDVNPSGRLSDTYWAEHSYNPAYANFGVIRYAYAADYDELPSEETSSYTGMTNTAYVSYTEGIYVGYRYTETRYYDVVTGRANAGAFVYDEAVAYPFGYGLSYTEFSYGDFNVKYLSAKDVYEVTFRVTNVGSKAGKEVGQVYLSKPYTDYDVANGVEKAAVELVGFVKTQMLEPGQSQECTVQVAGSSFASYDANNAKTYVTSNQDYVLTVAKNAHEATNNVLAINGYDTADGMTSNGDATLAKKVSASKDKYNLASNGSEITNLFDEADWNKYSHNGGTQITYVSRNNWQGTLPASIDDKTILTMNADMVNEIVGYLGSDGILPDDGENPTFGADLKYTLVELRVNADGEEVPFDSEVWDSLIDQLSWEELCSLITTGMRKTGSAPSVGKPATIEHNGPTGITQPYKNGSSGLANIYGDPDGEYSGTIYPCIGILAATFNVELAQEVGEMYGEDALWAGYSGLYGIAINTHRTAFDGRAFEYYSEDPYLTGSMASSLVSGLQSKGCNGYVKHFVGYEQQANRVGLAVWANEQTLREIYLKPFQMAIEQGGAMNCMAAYTRLGTQFCAGNKALLTDYLRGECGMKGFVVSDMFKGRYKNEQLPAFLMAGCDLPDGDLADDGVYDAYQTGYSEVVNRMRLAAKRILFATVHSNAMNGLSPSMKIVPVVVAWQVALKCVTVALGVLLAASVVGFVLGHLPQDEQTQEEKQA